MHLNDNSFRSVQELPIRARSGEVFHHEDVGPYDLGKAVEWINANPERFELATVRLSGLAEEMRRRGKFNYHYIASMARNDARRPVLIGRMADGTERLLDGRHRAARSLQLGYDSVEAWRLTVEQTEALRLLPPCHSA